MCFVKTEEEAKHIHEMRLQSISFQICQIAKVTHIQNIVVLWYFPSETKIPSMFLVPRILLHHFALLATQLIPHWKLVAKAVTYYAASSNRWSTGSGIARLGHTGVHALATRGCVLPVQVRMRIIVADSIIVDHESGTKPSWNRTAQYHYVYPQNYEFCTLTVHMRVCHICDIHYTTMWPQNWPRRLYKSKNFVQTNIVCPSCALALTMSWLHHWVTDEASSTST